MKRSLQEKYFFTHIHKKVQRKLTIVAKRCETASQASEGFSTELLCTEKCIEGISCWRPGCARPYELQGRWRPASRDRACLQAVENTAGPRSADVLARANTPGAEMLRAARHRAACLAWVGARSQMCWWFGLAQATLEFWVRFPNERNQGVLKFTPAVPAKVCVLITAVPSRKLFAWGEGDSGGHVLLETTSRGICGLVCPSRQSV